MADGTYGIFDCDNCYRNTSCKRSKRKENQHTGVIVKPDGRNAVWL